MTRPCLALAAALFACAPLLAQDTPADPAADYARIQDYQRKKRVSPKKDPVAFRAYARQLKRLAREFVRDWEPRAELSPAARMPLARCHLILATQDIAKPEKASVHLERAEGHARAHQKASPEDPESGLVIKSVAMLRRAVERSKAIARKRAEGKARRELLHGKPAPALEVDEVLDGAPGQTLALEDYRGKVVLLDFWATWCAPCRRVIPHLVALKKKHEDALVVLGMTKLYGRGFVPGPGGKGGEAKKGLDPAAEREVIRQCAAALGIDYPIVLSAKAGAAYHVQGIPQLVLIDKQGKVRLIKVGSGKTDELDERLAECLAE